MSQYYSIKCLNCDDVHGLGEDSNRAGQELAEFLESRKGFEELGLILPLYPVMPFWKRDPSYPSTVQAGWFAEHKGHEVVSWSEYGYRFGEEP